MSYAVLEQLIEKYMATHQSVYTFIWQGGEPTLMGPQFFRQAVTLQQQKGRSGARVANLLQTNCTNLDPELIVILKEYHFLIGVSLDGPQDLHDSYRRNQRGSGTHGVVVNGINALKTNGIPVNALTLITKCNFSEAETVYDHLCDLGIYHHQYIPCLELDENNEPMRYSISGGEWGKFLCTIFDCWFLKDTKKVSIRYFDAILSSLILGQAPLCHMGSSCRQYLVVEYNGDVYPCDFFVDPYYKLGNIMNDRFEDLYGSDKFLKFGKQKSAIKEECRACNWVKLCFGDCPKYRGGIQIDAGSAGPSTLCLGYKLFFDHAIERLQGLASQIRARGFSPQILHMNS